VSTNVYHYVVFSILLYVLHLGQLATYYHCLCVTNEIKYAQLTCYCLYINVCRWSGKSTVQKFKVEKAKLHVDKWESTIASNTFFKFWTSKSGLEWPIWSVIVTESLAENNIFYQWLVSCDQWLLQTVWLRMTYLISDRYRHSGLEWLVWSVIVTDSVAENDLFDQWSLQAVWHRTTGLMCDELSSDIILLKC